MCPMLSSARGLETTCVTGNCRIALGRWGAGTMFEIRTKCHRCGRENCFVTVPDNLIERRCIGCSLPLLRVTRIRGFLYVLSNDQMPGLLKIGCTERDVDSRVAELNSATGVPASFQVEAYFGSMNPFEDESRVHRTLRSFRLANDREFFKCQAESAIDSIEGMLGKPPTFRLSMPQTTQAFVDEAPILNAFGSREELQTALRLYPADALLPCAICPNKVKAKNLLRHYDKVHFFGKAERIIRMRGPNGKFDVVS